MIAKLKEAVLRHKLVWALVAAAALIAFPLVVQSNFIRGIAVRTVLFMLFASSLNLINGYCGHMSIGHAGFMCIGCYTAALLSTKAGLNFWVLLIVSGLVTALFGFLVSLPTLKLSGIYLSIVTLGFSEIVRIVVLNWTSLTNGPLGVKNIPHPNFFGFEISTTVHFYYLILALLAVSVFCMYRILNSRVGRAWMSIRENPDAASSLGVELSRYKALNFVTGAFFCGMAGCFMAYYYRYIDTLMFTIDAGFDVLAMVIVGGMGTLVGPIVGAFLINMITEALRNFGVWRMAIYGILIIFVMWVRPQGIAGASNSVLAIKRLSSKKKATANAGGKAVRQ